MTPHLPALAVLAVLALPAVALAGPEDDEAEYRRLSTELQRHAERNTYAGMERSYVALRGLKGVTLSAADHRLGAAAARNAGDVTAMVERMRLAEAAEATDEGAASIKEVEDNYGAVDLRSKVGTAELAISQRPFKPDQGAAYDFAAAAVASGGKYEGWLPAGDYTFGEEGFSVAAGGDPVVVDLRKTEKESDKCTGSTTGEQLMASLDVAGGAWDDIAALAKASDKARFDLPCYTAPAQDNPHLLAEFHRVEGLRHYLDGNPEPASMAWAAARIIEPKYEFPALPADNPARDVYALENIKTLEMEVVRPPAKGHIRFDGRATLNRPSGLPAVIQLIDDTGKVTYTGYHGPGDLPTYKPLPEGEKSAYRYEGQGSPGVAVMAGSGLLAVAGGVVYGMALGAKGKFNESTNPEEGRALQAQANSLGATGLGLGGVGLIGLGVGAALTGSF